MKTINLHGKYGEGKTALVSDEDYEMLSKQYWVVRRDHKTRNLYYVGCYNKGIVYMHRAVLGDKEGHVVDHINRNTFDNRRENLRHATARESTLNRRPFTTWDNSKRKIFKRGDKPGYTKVGKKYQSQIGYKGKSYYLGLFDTIEEAHSAYLRKYKELENL